MNIVFIRLGMMGYPIAHLLAVSGRTLPVKNLKSDMAQRFVIEHSGVKVGASHSDLAQSDVVITLLPDSNAVETVVLGKTVLSTTCTDSFKASSTRQPPGIGFTPYRVPLNPENALSDGAWKLKRIVVHSMVSARTVMVSNRA